MMYYSLVWTPYLVLGEVTAYVCFFTISMIQTFKNKIVSRSADTAVEICCYGSNGCFMQACLHACAGSVKNTATPNNYNL